MKSSLGLLTVALGAALVLQGCAGNSELTYAPGAAPTASQTQGSWEATGPNTAVISTPAPDGKAIVKADTKENFEAVVAAIQKQMQPGGRWQYVNQKERATIDGSFADMTKLYDQYGSVDKMDQAAKVRLLADQSTVNAILTKKDGDRLICQSQIPVGSHLPVKTCQTYAEMEARQRATQRQLMQLNQQQGFQRASDKSGGH